MLLPWSLSRSSLRTPTTFCLPSSPILNINFLSNLDVACWSPAKQLTLHLMLSPRVGAVLLTERRSTALALAASSVSKALKAQRRGVMVRSNDCWTIPKNDLQRVECTRSHQTATLLKRDLNWILWRNKYEMNIQWSLVPREGDEILPQVFPLSCSSCPLKSSTTTSQHWTGSITEDSNFESQSGWAWARQVARPVRPGKPTGQGRCLGRE